MCKLCIPCVEVTVVAFWKLSTKEIYTWIKRANLDLKWRKLRADNMKEIISQPVHRIMLPLAVHTIAMKAAINPSKLDQGAVQVRCDVIAAMMAS